MQNPIKIHLTRSHYSKLVVAGCDAGGDDDGVGGLNGPGWWTAYDGGQGSIAPGYVVALYVEDAEWEPEPGSDWRPTMWALALDRNAQNPRGGSLVSLKGYLSNPDYRSKQEWQPTKMLETAIDGLYGVKGCRWQLVAEKDVPADVRRVLDRAVETVLGLYGQGGDFFA